MAGSLGQRRGPDGRVSAHPQYWADTEGEYYVRQDQYQSFGDLSTLQVLAGLDERGQWPGGSLAWGSHRIELFPSPGTETFGRTGMFIHGGYLPGSAGCVDLTEHVDSFIRRFHRLGRSVRLTVDYSDGGGGGR